MASQRRMFGELQPANGGLAASRALPLAAGVSLAAVAAALATQHIGGMQPCAWCVLQRLIFIVLAAAALLGWGWSSPTGRRVGAGLGIAAALSGMATALWQHFVANNSASCAMTLADRVVGATGLDRSLPQVFAAYASCSEAKAWLLGVPYEFYSLALYAALAALLFPVLRSGR